MKCPNCGRLMKFYFLQKAISKEPLFVTAKQLYDDNVLVKKIEEYVSNGNHELVTCCYLLIKIEKWWS